MPEQAPTACNARASINISIDHANAHRKLAAQ
jgi:hypothetical protein